MNEMKMRKVGPGVWVVEVHYEGHGATQLMLPGWVATAINKWVNYYGKEGQE